MGETVEFPSNGSAASGYLARPAAGSGPGVLVLQEWWGLNPQIKGVCDRLAAEGFTALAPDLYHGELASHQEMDKANKLMSELPPDRAARDMGGAVDFLIGHEAATGQKVGVVGFCMGGMLTLLVAAQQGDKVGAAVPYYGAPLGDREPDWSNLSAKVEGHIAGNDNFFPPDAIRALEKKLRDMGKDATFHTYEGAGHAFANEENAMGSYNQQAADQAWGRTIAFFRSALG
jgi:carboxymethylenebutenolidase